MYRVLMYQKQSLINYLLLYGRRPNPSKYSNKYKSTSKLKLHGSFDRRLP